MTSTLLIVQILLALAITISVLLQKSSSIGLGAYSGSNETMFGAKGPMGFLAKVTFTLGLLFVLNTLVLSYLYTTQSNKSVADSIVSSIPAMPTAQKSKAPTAPNAAETAVQPTNATIPDANATHEAPKPAAN